MRWRQCTKKDRAHAGVELMLQKWARGDAKGHLEHCKAIEMLLLLR